MSCSLPDYPLPTFVDELPEVLTAAWRAEHAEVIQLADGCGYRIDPGIVDTVVVLRLLGIPTNASCEGHLLRGDPEPWVGIGIDYDVERWQTEIAPIQRELPDDETSDEYVRMLDLMEERIRAITTREEYQELESSLKRLAQLLDDFHQRAKLANFRKSIGCRQLLTLFTPFDVRQPLQSAAWSSSRL